MEERKDHSNLLKSLIRESTAFFLSFITEPRITAGIVVSRMQGDAAAGCHGSGAP